MKETLEETAERLYLSHENNELLYGHSEDLQLAYKAGIFDGAKWQAERMYSYDELRQIAYNAYCLGQLEEPTENKYNLWIQQFKKD